MKKLCFMFICFLTVILAGCGNKVSSGKSDIYKVDVTKTTVNAADHWIVSGTTSAPDGAKIVAQGPAKLNAASKINDYAWAKVKNGKFKAEISPRLVLDVAKSHKVKVYLFAITNYKKEVADSVPQKYLTAYKSKFDLHTFKLSKAQYRFVNSMSMSAEAQDIVGDNPKISKMGNNFAKADMLQKLLDSIVPQTQTLKDVKCDIDSKTGKVNSVTFILDDQIQNVGQDQIDLMKNNVNNDMDSICQQLEISPKPTIIFKSESGQTY
ncbi:hypothetical protein [Limosilactobacillus frumenti]|nr:hypothetical protein [Limosilactobacillus frumenti]MBA2913406.1 hypothetical protein [Limosilactobacillus frumenti]QFG72713.1 hypothetical protein LF145_04900 [Limosilactobacillus frumenti]